MTLKSVLIAAISVTSLLWTHSSTARGAEDEAVGVRPGESFASELSPAGDVDTYSVDLLAGERFDAVVKCVRAGRHAPSGIDELHLALIAPDGETIVAEATGRRRTRLRHAVAAASGPYALQVSGAGVGAYVLRTAADRTRRIAGEWEAFGEADARTIPFDATAGMQVDARIDYRGGLVLLDGLDGPSGPATGFQDGAAVQTRGRVGRGRIVLKPFALQDGSGTYGLVLGRHLGAPELRVKLRTVRERLSREERQVRVVAAAEPELLGIAPASGRPRTRVTLTGRALVSGARVTFGGVPSPTVTVESPERAVAVVPDGLPAGTVTVRYESPDRQAFRIDDAFRVTALATVGSFTPAEAPESGGTTVELTGTGFSDDDRPTVAGNAVSDIVARTSTTLRFTLPPLSAGSARLGVVDSLGNRAEAPGTLTVVAAPALSAATPNIFPASGAPTVVVTGSRFGADSVVRVGGTTVAATVTSSTSLRFTAPARPTGPADITVEDRFGQSAALRNALTYFAFRDGSDALPGVAGDDWGGSTVRLADIDGDTRSDVLVTAAAALGGGGSATRVLRREGNGFVDRTATTFPSPTAGDGGDALDVLLVDIDGDGVAEILRARDSGAGSAASASQLRVWRRAASGAYVDATSSLVATPGSAHDLRARGLAASDIDGDGDIDVALVSRDSFTFLDGLTLRNSVATRLLRNENGVLVDRSEALLPLSADSGDDLVGDCIAMSDLDGDGAAEIVISRTDGAPAVATRVLANDGSGAFSLVADALPAANGAERFQAAAILSTDIDGDLDRDLILTLPVRFADGRSATRILRNTGDLSFEDATTQILSGADALDGNSADHFEADALAAGDVDGDGDLDLVLVAGTIAGDTPFTRVLLQGAAGRLATLRTDVAASTSDPWPGVAVAIGDADGDGDLDVVVADVTGGATDRRTRILRQDR